jgi:hypothetical protein
VLRALCLLSALAAVVPGPLAAEPVASDAPAAAETSQTAPARQKLKFEPTVLPGVGYDSNVGFAFGLVGDLSATAPGAELHAWRVYSYLFASIRDRGGIEFSRITFYNDVDVPNLAGGRVRLLPRFFIRFYKVIGYYGLGNAAPLARPWEQFDRREQKQQWADARQFQEYERLRVFIRTDARIKLVPTLDLFAGGGATITRIDVFQGSRLAQDLAGASGPWVQQAVSVGAEPHVLFDGQVGLLVDRRDEETDPTRGFSHELSIRLGAVAPDSAGFVGMNATGRWYVPVHDMLTVGMRLMADLMVGRPPLYELSEFGGLRRADAVGGQTGIRGLPTWRYHGKIKLIGNIEARLRFVEFTLLKRRAMIGMVAFVDVGRVWADWKRRPELDGGGIGLKPAPGAGLRLRWGETAMVRADVAIGENDWQFYVDVGHVF